MNDEPLTLGNLDKDTDHATVVLEECKVDKLPALKRPGRMHRQRLAAPHDVGDKMKPILFSGPMVRAILDGSKTQTRRVVKPQLRWGWEPFAPLPDQYPPHRWRWRNGDTHEYRFMDCPYGCPGDRLWVRETWAMEPHPIRVVYPEPSGTFESPGAEMVLGAARHVPSVDADRWLERRGYVYVDGHGHRCIDTRRSATWNPSIHMPRWASRLTLEITDVRVERLTAISEEDARAEGMDWVAPHWPNPRDVPDRDEPNDPGPGPSRGVRGFARDNFHRVWDSINGARPGCSWDADPWVWVLTFKRVEGE